jgi:alkanesulfonate monooxygenase SsuD/methylene tetrahydromethanopterin reductase-like flavin-dependent oxidoreductase (luciferase family)
MHTTGLVVKEAAERWEIPAALTRRVHGIRLYSPSLRTLDLASAGYYFLATDTPALMRWLAREAARSGAHLRFGRTYAGEPEELIKDLAEDEAIAAADTLLLTIPNQLGVDYNAHLIGNVLRHLGPELGWR